MEKVNVIQTSDPQIFAERVNNSLKEGYKVSSTNCGVIVMPHDYNITMYQAILIKTTNQPK